MSKILSQIKHANNAIAVLIDPEKTDNGPRLIATLENASTASIDFIFIGGSTVSSQAFQKTCEFIKKHSAIPLVIFPGSSQQISEKADGLLYLSLLSGRNPDYLIGHHIDSATELAEMDLEIIPTGYLLIDGGTRSSVAYVSQTTPIPRNNISIAKRTAIAAVSAPANQKVLLNTRNFFTNTERTASATPTPATNSHARVSGE
jgi:putative glycerol-1-phosphate prenyltransferase